jgi:uncharacterized LabA/DUF88 family protein
MKHWLFVMLTESSFFYNQLQQTERHMSDHHYLFVDGGYFRARHTEAIKSVFGESSDLQLGGIANMFAVHIQRVFYYDCLNDIPKIDETEEQLKNRIEAQQKYFDEIQACEGFHVRLGSLSGNSRKFRQKEVDILLAVDALDHAFRENMAGIILVAGDRDFAPLVESLVRLGVWVHIWYDARSVGRRLLEVADKAVPIGFCDYYNCCSSEFVRTHPLPIQRQNVPERIEEVPDYQLLKTGKSGSQTVRLFRHGNEHMIVVNSNPPWILQHNDQAVLENFFRAVHGQIVWEEQ